MRAIELGEGGNRNTPVKRIKVALSLRLQDGPDEQVGQAGAGLIGQVVPAVGFCETTLLPAGGPRLQFIGQVNHLSTALAPVSSIKPAQCSHSCMSKLPKPEMLCTCAVVNAWLSFYREGLTCLE